MSEYNPRVMQLNIQLAALKHKNLTANTTEKIVDSGIACALPQMHYPQIHSQPAPMLAQKSRFALVDQEMKNYSHSKKKIGFIKRPATLSAVAAAILAVFLVPYFLFLRTNSAPVSSPAQATVLDAEIKSLEEEYKRVATEQKYGEKLFESLSLADTPVMKVGEKTIIFGTDDTADAKHVSYTVFPGQKGQSIFDLGDGEQAKEIAKMIPGTRVAITTESKKQFKLIFVSANTFPKNATEYLINTSRSLVVLKYSNRTADEVFQFRLVGVDTQQ